MHFIVVIIYFHKRDLNNFKHVETVVWALLLTVAETQVF